MVGKNPIHGNFPSWQFSNGETMINYHTFPFSDTQKAIKKDSVGCISQLDPMASPYQWGFLKMEDPQVTMGFNTKSWMIWGFDFRKPPYSISRFVHRFCSQVWEYKDQGGTFGGTNRPYAGAWGEDKPLEKGEHKIQLYSMGTPPLGRHQQWGLCWKKTPKSWMGE